MSSVLLFVCFLVLPALEGTRNINYISPLSDRHHKYNSCYPDSYLLMHSKTLITNNSVTYFYQGTHVFDRDLLISDVHNITLQGLGEAVKGFHDTVLRNTVVLTCRNGVNAGLIFVNVTNSTISDLVISRCNGQSLMRASPSFYNHLKNINSVVFEESISQHSSLLIVQSTKIIVSSVSVVNVTGFALTTVNLFNSTITNSSFAANNLQYPCAKGHNRQECKSGNALVAYTYSWLHECRLPAGDVSVIMIEHSNFSFGYSKLDFKRLHRSFGGGLTILLDHGKSYCVHVSLKHIVAFNNTAKLSGNVNFFVTQPTNCYEFNCSDLNSRYGNVNFKHNIYDENRATSGGGLQISLGTNTPLNRSLHCKKPSYQQLDQQKIYFENCNFTDNFAEYGGGANIWIRRKPVHLFLYHCTFSRNQGIRGIGVYVNQNGRRPMISYNFTEVTVSNSTYVGREHHSSADDIRSSISFFHMKNANVNNLHVISNNPCYGAFLYNSCIRFTKGKSTFYNNTSTHSGGAMLLSTASNIALQGGAIVNFTSNRAVKVGGAIHVNTRKLIDFCFLDVSDEYSKSSGQLVFIDNTAGLHYGDAIYIKSCTRLLHDQKFIRSKNFFQIIRLQNQSNSSNPISSDPFLTFHCHQGNESNVKNCRAYPGQTISLLIYTTGLFNTTNKGLIWIKETKGNTTSKYFARNTRHIASITNDSQQCVPIPFTVKATQSINNTFLSVFTMQKEYDLQGMLYWNEIHFNITILKCPTGFALKHSICQCDPFLKKLLGSNTTCNITTKQITRSGSKWIGSMNHFLLIASECPYDYCRAETMTIDMAFSNEQCNHNRVGILCGNCSGELSLMLGSNDCGHCSNMTLFVITAFAAAGVALVMFLIALNMTVSVGTINGIVFYANVIKIKENAFLNNSWSLPVLYQFVSWLNLDLGINACFSNKLDTVTKLWLQFVFPAYIWILIGIVIIICKYSQNCARLIGHNAVPVFATLILLSYTKALRILVPVLTFTKVALISENNDSIHYHQYWSANGNIPLSSPGYLSLACFSLLITVLFAMPYTLLLLFRPFLLSKLRKPIIQRFCLNFKSLFDAYYGPYHPRFHIWTGVLLCVRIILVIVASFATVDVYLTVTGSLAVILLTIFGLFNKLRKKTFAYYLEYWSILNVALLPMVQKVTHYASAISIGVMLLTFTVSILYHIITLKKVSRYIIRKIRRDEAERLLLGDDGDLLRTVLVLRQNVRTTIVNTGVINHLQ